MGAQSEEVQALSCADVSGGLIPPLWSPDSKQSGLSSPAAVPRSEGLASSLAVTERRGRGWGVRSDRILDAGWARVPSPPAASAG